MPCPAQNKLLYSYVKLNDKILYMTDFYLHSINCHNPKSTTFQLNQKLVLTRKWFYTTHWELNASNISAFTDPLFLTCPDLSWPILIHPGTNKAKCEFLSFSVSQLLSEFLVDRAAYAYAAKNTGNMPSAMCASSMNKSLDLTPI